MIDGFRAFNSTCYMSISWMYDVTLIALWPHVIYMLYNEYTPIHVTRTCETNNLLEIRSLKIPDEQYC